jgi:hypothetical protein
MAETRTALTIARRPFAAIWLACSAIVLCGLACTTIALQLAIGGRLVMVAAPGLVAEATSAIVQGLVIALWVRRRC